MIIQRNKNYSLSVGKILFRTALEYDTDKTMSNGQQVDPIQKLSSYGGGRGLGKLMTGNIPSPENPTVM